MTLRRSRPTDHTPTASRPAPLNSARRAARAPQKKQEPTPLDEIRRVLSEAAGAQIPDPVQGVKELLLQHTALLAKYERARELLQLEWSQKRNRP